MGFFALQVRFEENITQFFPDTKDSQNTIKVFDNLKIKDKIIIMLSSADTCHRVEPDSLIEAAGQLQQTLTEKTGGKLIKGIFAQVDQSLIQGATDFVYEHLPLFLTDTDYQRFDSLLTDKGIQAAMQKNYTNLLSPAGIALRSYCWLRHHQHVNIVSVGLSQIALLLTHHGFGKQWIQGSHVQYGYG